MTPFFSYTFWALTVRGIIFVFEKCQNSLLWGPLFGPFWSIKYLNFWGNIYIKESKEPVFIFSMELRTKFVWSHGNWFQDYINQKLEVVNENIMRHHRYMKYRVSKVSKVIWSIFFIQILCFVKTVCRVTSFESSIRYHFVIEIFGFCCILRAERLLKTFYWKQNIKW